MPRLEKQDLKDPLAVQALKAPQETKARLVRKEILDEPDVTLNIVLVLNVQLKLKVERDMEGKLKCCEDRREEIKNCDK